MFSGRKIDNPNFVIGPTCNDARKIQPNLIKKTFLVSILLLYAKFDETQDYALPHVGLISSSG